MEEIQDLVREGQLLKTVCVCVCVCAKERRGVLQWGSSLRSPFKLAARITLKLCACAEIQNFTRTSVMKRSIVMLECGTPEVRSFSPPFQMRQRKTLTAKTDDVPQFTMHNFYDITNVLVHSWGGDQPHSEHNCAHPIGFLSLGMCDTHFGAL